MNNDDYAIVEKVYAFYPGMPDVDGKKVAAQLYRQFGMTIFQDMYERASKGGALFFRYPGEEPPVVEAADAEPGKAEGNLL